jgi:hypothetical protein
MAVYDRLFNHAKAYLPGAGEDMLKYELFAMLDEFFIDTGIWRETISVGVTTDGYLYEIEPDTASAKIVRLHSVTHDGSPVRAALTGSTELTFFTAPTAAYTYEVILIVSVGDPVSSSTGMPEVPEWIYERYFNTLLAGLISKMMGQPAKPYSNEAQSIIWGRKFRSGMNAARRDANVMHLNDGQRWRFPAFV